MINEPGSIKIGVSGHRHLDDPIGLSKSIHNVLNEIYSLHNRSEFHLYSPLAVGADQLVAECGLENPRTHLIVLLPMPLNDYLHDFSDTQRLSFKKLYKKRNGIVQLPNFLAADDAYLEAGRYIVDHSDYLITLWNGRTERGKGGTAQVVKLARKNNLPVAWIRANNAIKASSIPLNKSLEQGSIEYINWRPILK